CGDRPWRWRSGATSGTGSPGLAPGHSARLREDDRVSMASGALRRLIRRSAWLMLGAAIGLAVILLTVSVLSVIAGNPSIPVVVLLSVIAGAALGLVPGARELEVTAARSMLQSDADLIVPGRPRNAHR